MSNPLFQQMHQMPMQNNLQTVMQRFNQFRQMFTGDPRQQVQSLLNSGKISQSQYNQAVEMANQLQRMIGR